MALNRSESLWMALDRSGWLWAATAIREQTTENDDGNNGGCSDGSDRPLQPTSVARTSGVADAGATDYIVGISSSASDSLLLVTLTRNIRIGPAILSHQRRRPFFTKVARQ